MDMAQDGAVRADREVGRQHPRGAGSSLRDRAYQIIKRQIVTCELKPGEVLSEGAISAALDIGRTPVHQALDRLMVDGLIDVLPRKGVVVRPLSLDEVLEIIDVRIVNETFSARRAAEHATRTEIAMLRGNVVRMNDAAKRRDIAELMQLDRDFHSTLSVASRNSILSDFLANLHDRALRFWFVSLRSPDHHDRVCKQHAAIVDAIEAHDSQAAAAAMQFHIEEFRANITRQI